jgi:hypothetical protein
VSIISFTFPSIGGVSVGWGSFKLEFTKTNINCCKIKVKKLPHKEWY